MSPYSNQGGDDDMEGLPGLLTDSEDEGKERPAGSTSGSGGAKSMRRSPETAAPT